MNNSFQADGEVHCDTNSRYSVPSKCFKLLLSELLLRPEQGVSTSSCQASSLRHDRNFMHAAKENLLMAVRI